MAVMVMVAGAVNVALLAGDVIDTVGGWFALTVTVTAADVVFNPPASWAFAVSECVPAGTDDHVNEYGAAVSVPSSVVPL